MSPPPASPSQQPYTPRHLAERILASRSALEGEHKQVTVLFCDLAGSTAIATTLGPEAMHALLNWFFELALAEVHRYEGTINQFLGDGFMALFGAPLAHEDHARRAVLAALAIHRVVRAHHAELGQRHGVELALRIGLNTGPVVVGKIGDNLRMDYTAVGDTTNLAARLQQLAEPATIFVSGATHGLVEGYVESAFLGEREVKGLGLRKVYRVERLRPGAARFDAALRRGLTPLVGRRRELDTLERCWQEARAGTMRVVNVSGEAGIGKSRLLYEFRQRLDTEQVAVLQGHCSAYGTAASFLPFIEVLRTAFRLDQGDSQPETEGKLRQGLERLGIEPEPIQPFLLNLLGLDPGREAFQGLDGEIVGMRTREILQTLLRERCRRSQVVLAIDDLHWTDTASEDLLLRVIRTAERLPLLIVNAYRPAYRPPWAGRAEAMELPLEALEHPYSLALAWSNVGMLCGVRGDLDAAARLLERALALSREANMPIMSLYVMTFLPYVYALSGRVEEGVSMGLETLTSATTIGVQTHSALATVRFGESCLLAGQPDPALAFAGQALTMARELGQRGGEAWALHLLGEIASHGDFAEVETAEGHFRDAMALADQLGMRPLVAHCHLGLGRLYRRTGKRQDAREHLTTAATMYRDMGMEYWLEKAEQEMRS